MLLHALQYVDLDYSVRETDTEKLGFKFLKALFIFDCLLPFSLYFLFFSLSAYLVFYAVMLGFKVGGTKIFRAMSVFAQSAECVHIITPQGNVGYFISASIGYLVGLPVTVKVSRAIEKIAQMFNPSCFHQCFCTTVRKQCRNECCRGYIVKIILETIPAECVRNLELRICLRIGCILVGFVVVANCHRSTKGKCINVMSQYTLYGNQCFPSLCIPPILPDFKHIVFSLAAFLHFSHEEEHTQNLIPFTSGKRGKIPLLL